MFDNHDLVGLDGGRLFRTICFQWKGCDAIDSHAASSKNLPGCVMLNVLRRVRQIKDKKLDTVLRGCNIAVTVSTPFNKHELDRRAVPDCAWGIIGESVDPELPLGKQFAPPFLSLQAGRISDFDRAGWQRTIVFWPRHRRQALLRSTGRRWPQAG